MSPSNKISPPFAMSVLTASNPPNHPFITIAKSNFPHTCNFCKKKFASSYGLAGHYNIHKNLPNIPWVKHGPRGSKIQKEILKAVEEGKNPSPQQHISRIVSPDVFRVAPPPRVNSFSHPWWALGLINVDPEGRKPMIGLLGSRGLRNSQVHHTLSRVNEIKPRNLTISTAKPAFKYTCTFCKKKYSNRHAFSAHYRVHRTLPATEWVERGPPRSKIRKAILKALEEVPSSSHRTPTNNRNPSNYPWRALRLTDVSPTSGEPTVKVLDSRGLMIRHAYKSGLGEEVGAKKDMEANRENIMPAAIHCKKPLPDLNEPYSPGMSP